jgi:hypothetical protein
MITMANKFAQELVHQSEQFLPANQKLCDRYYCNACRCRSWHPLASSAGDVLTKHCLQHEDRWWNRKRPTGEIGPRTHLSKETRQLIALCRVFLWTMGRVVS